MTKNFDIIEPSFKKIKGSIQILIKNIGKHDRIQNMEEEEGKLRIQDTRRKVVSTKAIDPREILMGELPIQHGGQQKEAGDTQL